MCIGLDHHSRGRLRHSRERPLASSAKVQASRAMQCVTYDPGLADGATTHRDPCGSFKVKYGT